MKSEEVLKEFMVHQSTQNKRVYRALEDIVSLIDIVNTKVNCNTSITKEKE